MNNHLSYINRKTKCWEKHLDVLVVFPEGEIPTVFERFESISYDEATLVMHSAEMKKRYKLHYDFTTGKLTELKSGNDIEITDSFSNRHFRAILYAGTQALLTLDDETKGDTFSAAFRKINKRERNADVPVVCFEWHMDHKRWFMVTDIIAVSDKQIEMSGLMSIVNFIDQISLPVKARCIFNINNNSFRWNYLSDGKPVSECLKGKVDSPSTVHISDILYAYTEYLMNHPEEAIEDSAWPELRDKCRKIMKNQQIQLFSKQLDDMGHWGYLDALFYDIKSVSDKEIVFRVCDGEQLLTDLIYDREQQKIFVFVRNNSYNPRARKKKFSFMIDPETNNQRKFQRMVLLIEDWVSARK